MLIDFQNKIGTHTCFWVDWIVHLAKVSMDDEHLPNENQRHNISKEFQTYTIWDISHPPKKSICQEDNCHPQFFFLFLAHLSWLFRLTAQGGHQGWERRRCLTRWSCSTSSRGCVTRWSWSTSSRRCLKSWSWSTSSRGRRWKRSPRW